MIQNGNSEGIEVVRVLAMLEAYTISGSAKGVLEFAREAVKCRVGAPRVELSLITFRRPMEREQPVLRDAIRELGISWELLEESGRFDRTVIGRLRDLYRRQNPHVVWSNSVKSHFLVRLAGLHRTCGWVAFHHGYTSTDLKMRLYNHLDRWSLRAADQLLTVCLPFAAQLEAYGVPRQRIIVQHMPLRQATAAPGNDEVAELRSRLGLSAEEKVIFTAGRLSKEKGHIDLLRAFARLKQVHLPPLRLVLAGEGPERGNLLAAARVLCIESNLNLVGYQNHLAPYYAIANVFVLPSHSEGSPNVLLEAIAAGVPVVATSVGGIPELMCDGREGLLVPKSDVDAMAAAMRLLLEDQSLANRLTAGARGVVDRNTPGGYYDTIAGVLKKAARIGVRRRCAE